MHFPQGGRGYTTTSAETRRTGAGGATERADGLPLQEPPQAVRADRAETGENSKRGSRESSEQIAPRRRSRSRRADIPLQAETETEPQTITPRRTRAGTEEQTEPPRLDAGADDPAQRRPRQKTPSRGAAGYSFNIKLFYFDGEKLRADRAERRRRSARRRSRRRAAKAPPQAVRAGKNAENRRISFINKLLKTEFQFFLRGRVIVRASEKIEKKGIKTRDRGIRSAQARPSAPGFVRLHKNRVKTLCKIPYCKTRKLEYNNRQ